MVVKTDRMRHLRKSKGWTQAELAGAAETNHRTIQRAESGKRVSLETLKAIASSLEVDLSDLMVPDVEPASSTDIDSRIEDHIRKRDEVEQENQESVALVASYWQRIVPGCTLSDRQRSDLEKWLGRFDLEEILFAMDICRKQYVELTDD